MVVYGELGIVVNMKKTKIVPIEHFKFMKIRYYLTETGKVIMKPARKSITRMRRKIRRLRRFVDTGELGDDDIRCAYESWRGYIRHTNSHITEKNMNRILDETFGITMKQKRGRR